MPDECQGKVVAAVVKAGDESLRVHYGHPDYYLVPRGLWRRISAEAAKLATGCGCKG